MASHEELLIESLKIDRGRTNQYCRTVSPKFLEQLNTQKPATMVQLVDIWYGSQNCNCDRNQHYNDSRYAQLNLHSVFTKGTVEFRLFNSTTHAGKIKAYIQFCLAVNNQALTQKSASARITETTNPKYTFRTWLLRLGLIGEEFKTARLHLLANLDGNIEWRNA